MPPAFRMLTRLIVCWNFTKGGIDEHSRVLKNYKPLFIGLNGYSFIWILLILSGVCNTQHVTKAVWIVPRREEHKSLEQLNTNFSRYGSFSKNLHGISKHLMLEDIDGSN